MLRQRLQNRTPLQFGLPIALLLLIVAATIVTAQSPDSPPREGIFDLYTRLEARPATAQPEVAIIEIGQESVDRIGPWPWPRTALAGLVTAALEAEAAAVVLTVPVDGTDPLSPEVAVRYWQRTDPSGDVQSALAQLPTNNAALSAAARDGDVAIGIARAPGLIGPWARSDILAIDWARFETETAAGFVALRAAPNHGTIDPGFDETGLVSISALPVDQDGIFRRTPLLWARSDRPAPSAALAAHTLAHGAVTIEASGRSLEAGGAPLARLKTANENAPIALDSHAGSIRLWLPKTLGLPTVQAWRALESGASWTQPLKGRIVFIGETTTPQSHLETARGPLPIANIHAYLAEQLNLAAAPARPNWAGWIEGLGALGFGLLTLLIALTLRPFTAILAVTVVSAAAFAGGLLMFQRTGLLVDPLPVIWAAIGAPAAALLVHIIAMLRGGDVARATFHGSLPTATVNRLKAQGPGRMLDGTRREVTVMSCGLRLPADIAAAYEQRPTDYMALTGAFTDALRRTILSSGGTVDSGEDGRLLGYWNAPEAVGDPIERACGCALKMIEEMNRLAENMESSTFGRVDMGGFADAKLEIGITSGPAFAGALGHGARKRYAVIGKPVERAGRLRERAALYGPAIITDHAVFDALRHQYAFLDLDVISSPDADSDEAVYGLSGNSFLKASKAFRTLADTQRELVLSWRNGDIAAATIQLQRLRGIPGVPDAYVDLYDGRVRAAHAKGRAAPSGD